MKYSVRWKKGAEDALAAIWLAAADRTPITRAAREIDLRLARRPEHEGESRSAGFRILLVRPLGVKYKVSTPDRIVRVVDIWRWCQTFGGGVKLQTQRSSPSFYLTFRGMLAFDSENTDKFTHRRVEALNFPMLPCCN